MDRTLIANAMIVDGSGAAPFLRSQDALPAIMKDGRLHKVPATI